MSPSMLRVSQDKHIDQISSRISEICIVKLILELQNSTAGFKFGFDLTLELFRKSEKLGPKISKNDGTNLKNILIIFLNSKIVFMFLVKNNAEWPCQI